MLYRKILRPLLFTLPPETAHEMAVNMLSFALRTETIRRLAAQHFARSTFGELRRFGLNFTNPVGLAAGFDKSGRIACELAALGFGFIEVGTVTHLPQPGNAQPRLFRLPADRALINRQGFNNEGAAALAERLGHGKPGCVLGINIGKSRIINIEDATPDYLASFKLVRTHADYVAINISSPNTPNLRELQRADRLSTLIEALQRANHEDSALKIRAPVPLLIKVSPDLSISDLEMIVDVAMRAKVSGIIATNTTTARTNLLATPARIAACGEGGLSGAPLRARSTGFIATLRRLSRGSLEIVGVGGIFNADDAWEKICAGASLVQLYTGLIYEGVGVVRDINEGLATLMQHDGFCTLDEAVGCRADELAAAS